MPFDEHAKTFSMEQLEKAPFKGILKSKFPKKSLTIRNTENKLEESKNNFNYKRKDLIEILRSDLSQNLEPLRELGGFSEKIKNELKNSLIKKESFSIAAQKTSYLLSLGTILNFTGFKGLREKPLKETFEKKFLTSMHQIRKKFFTKSI